MGCGIVGFRDENLIKTVKMMIESHLSNLANCWTNLIEMAGFLTGVASLSTNQ